MTTLTAGEIAKYIRQPNEPLGAAIARFRNWEKTGLIKASGKRHPGTGRKKQYSTDALISAVFLQTLTSALGAPAVAVAPYLPKLAQALRDMDWREGTKVPPMKIAVIGKRPGSPELKVDIVEPEQIKKHILVSNFTVHTVINLAHIYDVLDNNP
jgi:hypothetical protein